MQSQVDRQITAMQEALRRGWKTETVKKTEKAGIGK
jgi:hypothetical protein